MMGNWKIQMLVPCAILNPVFAFSTSAISRTSSNNFEVAIDIRATLSQTPTHTSILFIF
jgi:hypothetical protein